MAQQIEHIIDENDVTIFSATADTAERGVSFEKVGIWYTPAQLTQIQAVMDRAKAFLTPLQE